MSLLKIQVPAKVLLTRPISACLSKHHLATASDVDHKFYELRTYSIKPECMGPFVQLTNQHMHLRLSHSKLIGYWSSDLGGINQVVHIWEYDNFAQRTAVRTALAEDSNWQKTYFQRITKMMVKQDNAVLKSVPDVPIQTEPHKDGGIYELRRYIMKPASPGVFLKPFLNALLARVAVFEKLNYGKLMGAWMTEVGDVNSVYHLMNYESMDKRSEGRHLVLSSPEVKNVPIPQDVFTEMKNQILIPMPFSPLK